MATLIWMLPIGAASRADEAVPADPQPRWWKGNIHTHSLWSDGNDFPEMIAEWYRTHGYHFLAISDHNILAEGERWMNQSAIVQRGGDTVIEKYERRYGHFWVETREGAEGLQYRLKPLNEYRALLEERGKFMLITGEEISDSVQGKPLHLNATNLKSLLQPLGGDSITAAMRANLRAANDQAEREGREIIVHLNHPNFGFGVTAKDLAEVLEERFYEVYNGHPSVGHLGDEEHPSVERIWDLANAVRLTQWPEADALMGVGTDDSHNYHSDEGSTPGRGWIMVRARHLTPESLIRAMNRGDFYASSGVSLQQVQYAPETRTLRVAVATEPEVKYRIDFVGTLRSEQTPADDQIGVVLASHHTGEASYQLTGRELYVRAVVTASKEHPNPSFADQYQQAWTQPVGWGQR